MYSRFVLIFPFPFSGTGERTHARVVSFTCVLLLEAQQEQTSKLRIFLIKLSHSSSTDRQRAITFGSKSTILFAYSVRTMLGSSRSVMITELP